MASSDKQRILVVDDEAIVVSLVRDALEDEDYEVFTAPSGAEALQIIACEPLHLLLTDIRMPGMDGIELVKRARDQQPDLAVIFMTGYANLNSAKNAIKQGAFDYIMKPFELPEIRQAVRNAIKAKAEVAEKTQAQELSKLTDLNQMLFATNDRASLVTSSLKFIMMHLRFHQGSATFYHHETDRCVTITVTEGQETQSERPYGPVETALQRTGIDALRYPVLVNRLEEHPVYRAYPDDEIRTYLYPTWAQPDQQIVLVPIVRTDTIYGWFALDSSEHIDHMKEADLKFLTVTAGQLAITMENLALLEETQKAYAGLKELQDETIRLEKVATRGQMSAEIGHELNNFLGVVSGNLQLLDMQLHKGNYQELGRYIAAMSDTIEKIKTFTANLMDLAPIASQKSVISFDKLMSEVVDYVKPQKRFQGVQLRVVLPSREVPFEGDPTQIQQLLYNLLNNAADAIADSRVKEIGVAVAVDEATGCFTASVRDTGCGFSSELLAKAFRERFTTKKLGHGFGLVVCNRIIANHRGTLHVDSTPGAGTTISIDFPLAQTEPALV